VIVIDDYAHHPTEVAATLAAARHAHEGRIVAVFQPHRFSRTAELGEELGQALSSADRVFVTDVYAAGEAPVPGVTGRTVLAGLSDASIGSYVQRRLDVAPALAAEATAGDMVLLLGAGDITQVADELAPLLQEA
jgi:UDP-N-acetylmuramate--alanine ligase